MKVRLDELLVMNGLAPDLKTARSKILMGVVLVNDQKKDKVGCLVSSQDLIRLKDKSSSYVSRGGEKLSGVIEELGIQNLILNATVLDIGSSTGGFTDCSLKYGAKKVIAVDVGSNQLHWSLRNHPNVAVFEKTHIRDFNLLSPDLINVVVVDISFNSISNLIADIRGLLPKGGIHLLLLVKPQFELKKTEVEAGGVIVDPELINLAVERVESRLAEFRIRTIKKVPSKIKGTKGNQEWFIFGITED